MENDRDLRPKGDDRSDEMFNIIENVRQVVAFLRRCGLKEAFHPPEIDDENSKLDFVELRNIASSSSF